MRRSTGVTMSAVVVFIGSAFTILLALITMLGSAALRSHRFSDLPPNLVSVVMIVEGVFFLGFGGLGIATGVGLINVKKWARISMVVFAVLLVLFFFPPALLLAFVKFPAPDDPNLPANFTTVIRAVIAIFFAAFAALGGLWLYFFNKASIKAEFQPKQPVVPSASAHSPAQPAAPAPAAVAPAFIPASPSSVRPLSITIIGWLLLVGSPLGLLSLLYSRAMFRDVPLAMFLLGFFISGPAAVMIFVLWMAAQVIASVGLLKLRNWGRLATIALQCLGILNVVLLVAIPANRVRFQTMMDAAMASIYRNLPQPVPFSFPAWSAMPASLPVFVVILWFLTTQKHAFTSPPKTPVRLL